MRKAFVAVLLIMGCVLVGCGQGRSATPVRPAALSDPFLGTAALEKAIADGLPKEVEFLAEFATPEQAARLASATAGAPIPIRMPKYGSHPDSLRGYFSGNPVTYLVPTLVNGEPVGEYIISVSDSGKLEVVSWGDGTYESSLYKQAMPAVIDALGQDAVIVYAPRPTRAVLGWSSKGEAAIFVSIEDTPISAPVGKLLRDRTAVDQANSLWSP